MKDLNYLPENDVAQIIGLSTDTKPTDVPELSMFWELDSGDFYYFTGAAWAKVGG